MSKVGRVVQVVGLLIAICGGLYLSAFFVGLLGPAEGPTARSLSAALFGELPIIGRWSFDEVGP